MHSDEALAALLRATRINTKLLLMVLGGEERIEMDLQQVENLVDAATALILHMEENHTVDELDDLNLQGKLANLKAAVDSATADPAPTDPATGDEPVTGEGTAEMPVADGTGTTGDSAPVTAVDENTPAG